MCTPLTGAFGSAHDQMASMRATDRLSALMAAISVFQLLGGTKPFSKIGWMFAP